LGFKSERTVNAWRQRNTLNFQRIIEVAKKNNISLDYLFSNVDNEAMQFKKKETNLLKELEKRIKK